MKPVISLDFGTSNTSLAISKDSKATVLRNNRNSRYTPSLVAFHGGRILVGEEVMKPIVEVKDIVYGMKDIIGLTFDERVVKKFRSDCRFNLQNDKGKIAFQSVDHFVTIEEVVAMLFLHLKDHVESIIGPLGGAVLTMPSSYGRTQRRALQDAAFLANIPVTNVIDETTAAAVNFALEVQAKKNLVTLVFQLGGSSIDVAIFNIHGTRVERLASVSTNQLGGQDFDKKLLSYTLHHSKVEKNADTIAKIQRACENAKSDLGLSNNVRISTDYPKVDVKISKQQFEAINASYLNLIKAMIDAAILGAKKTATEIDNYFLTGRSTRLPIVVEILEKKLGENKRKQVVEADKAAVKGAAQYAEYISGQMGTRLAVHTDAGLKYKISAYQGKITVSGLPKLPEDSSFVLTRQKCHESIDIIMKSLQKGNYTLDIEIVMFIGDRGGLSMAEVYTLTRKIDDYRRRNTDILRMETDIGRFSEEVDRVKNRILFLISSCNDENIQTTMQQLVKNCEEIERWIWSQKNSPEELEELKILLDVTTDKIDGLSPAITAQQSDARRKLNDHREHFIKREDKFKILPGNMQEQESLSDKSKATLNHLTQERELPSSSKHQIGGSRGQNLSITGMSISKPFFK